MLQRYQTPTSPLGTEEKHCVTSTLRGEAPNELGFKIKQYSRGETASCILIGCQVGHFVHPNPSQEVNSVIPKKIFFCKSQKKIPSGSRRSGEQASGVEHSLSLGRVSWQISGLDLRPGSLMLVESRAVTAQILSTVL